jgi:hypothetical protein
VLLFFAEFVGLPKNTISSSTFTSGSNMDEEGMPTNDSRVFVSRQGSRKKVDDQGLVNYGVMFHGLTCRTEREARSGSTGQLFRQNTHPFIDQVRSQQACQLA